MMLFWLLLEKGSTLIVLQWLLDMFFFSWCRSSKGVTNVFG